MRHQLIGLLARGVERNRVVNVVLFRKWQLGVGTIDGTGGGINKVSDTAVSTALQDMTKSNEVRIDIGRRILD